MPSGLATGSSGRNRVKTGLGVLLACALTFVVTRQFDGDTPKVIHASPELTEAEFNHILAYPGDGFLHLRKTFHHPPIRVPIAGRVDDPASSAVPWRSAPPLPDALVIHPGHYAWHGQVYDFTQPGNHTIENVVQRIVYDRESQDPDLLASSLAWAHSSNLVDRENLGPALEVWLAKATRRKVGGYCYDVARALTRIATEQGLESRTVLIDAHAVTEIKTSHGWKMYDLTVDRAYVDQDGAPLDTQAVIDRAETGRGLHAQVLAFDLPRNVGPSTLEHLALEHARSLTPPPKMDALISSAMKGNRVQMYLRWRPDKGEFTASAERALRPSPREASDPE